MPGGFDANEVINGKYGFLYDQDGNQLQTTQEFEAGVEFDKEEVQVPGKFLKSHKVMGGTGSGSIKMLKTDSRLTKKVAENPTAKYNYKGKLADPTSKGEEGILFIGVSFDSADLMKFAMGEITEVEMDFTYDDFKYLTAIE
jgi:hypothetical protein